MRARLRRHLFAQGLHSADPAVPRRLPLLHVCASAAQGRGEPICRSTRCSRLRAPVPQRIARRRCSRSATNRNCATASAREELAELGHETTLSYLAQAARLVYEETGLLPHVNPGLLMPRPISRHCARCRSRKGSCWKARPSVCASAADRITARLTRSPAARLATIRLAGEAGVPFTSGILIGIGETRAERIEALLALRDLHDRYGHIQEIIVQNFRPKSGTRMARCSRALARRSICGPSPSRGCCSSPR